MDIQLTSIKEWRGVPTCKPQRCLVRKGDVFFLLLRPDKVTLLELDVVESAVISYSMSVH